MKKYLIALVVALVLCIPAFASSVQYFAPQPVVLSQTGERSEHWTSTGDVYFYIRVNPSNNIPYLTAICEDSVHTVTVWYNEVGDGANMAVNVQLGNSTYYVKACSSILQSYTTTPSLAIFDADATDEDIASAFADYLENPNGTPSGTVTFTVPRGNVLYFQVDAAQTVNFTGNMPQLSYLVYSSENGPWGHTGIFFGAAASLPSSGTTFPLLSQSELRWFKDAKQNVLGQTKIGHAHADCIVNQWYALYCPDIWGQSGNLATNDIAGANVTVNGSFSSIKVYPLSETLDYSNPNGGSFVATSNDDFDSYYDGSPNESGSVTWTNEAGKVESPTVGGQNYVSPDASPEGLLLNIRTLLENIVSELKKLFTFGYEAIQSLTGMMQDFVSVFSGLYTWLPAPVYSALISAVIVAIVIGVFKVFL